MQHSEKLLPQCVPVKLLPPYPPSVGHRFVAGFLFAPLVFIQYEEIRTWSFLSSSFDTRG